MTAEGTVGAPTCYGGKRGILWFRERDNEDGRLFPANWVWGYPFSQEEIQSWRLGQYCVVLVF
jgi:hypothetical protein